MKTQINKTTYKPWEWKSHQPEEEDNKEMAAWGILSLQINKHLKETERGRDIRRREGDETMGEWVGPKMSDLGTLDKEKQQCVLPFFSWFTYKLGAFYRSFPFQCAFKEKNSVFNFKKMREEQKPLLLLIIFWFLTPRI